MSQKRGGREGDERGRYSDPVRRKRKRNKRNWATVPRLLFKTGGQKGKNWGARQLGRLGWPNQGKRKVTVVRTGFDQ